MIPFVSTFAAGLTLQPGGIISTGTPGGTGWGQDAALGGRGYVPLDCAPARYLRPGDVVEWPGSRLLPVRSKVVTRLVRRL